jgi:protein-S-isoprenylcysteine O-methyltransferase Ste14
MAHFPVNHPLRPTYRALGGLTGIYLVGFGVLGAVEAGGDEFFAQNDTTVLWQGANLGYSVIAIAAGLIVLIGTALGRNIDAVINKWGGYAYMALGLAALAVLRTDANYLNFTIPTVIVTMAIGLVLVTAGMYGTVGSDEEARAAQEARLVL